jgi:hypothetical protein
LFSLSFLNVSAQSEVEMEEDAEKLHDLYKKVNAIKDFRLIESGTGLSIGENYPAYQEALDGMQKTRLLRNDYEGFLAGFAKKYAAGADQDWKVPNELTRKFEPLKLGYDVGMEYDAIRNRFSYLDTAGERNALSALEQIKNTGTGDGLILKNLHEIYRVRGIEEARNLLSLAPLFDPGNERIERRAVRLASEVDETLKEYKAEEMKILEGRRWKGNVGSTSAGSPATLAGAGLKFMTGLPDWGGNAARGTQIKKVSIIGDWFVAERNALGMPTRYGLPAAVAVQDNTMAPDVVTVYEISLITQEPKKDTNFYGVWVGNVWRMLDKNLPK